MPRKVSEFEKKEGYPPEMEEDIVLLDPSAKPNFWKPKKVGEEVVGKLTTIVKTKFGDTLSLITSSGLVVIPISTALARVDFVSYRGRSLYFRYEGTVGRNCRLFKVVLLKG
jgi:hypothetical protein